MKFPIPLKDKLNAEQVATLLRVAGRHSVSFNADKVVYEEPTIGVYLAIAVVEKAGENHKSMLLLVEDMLREDGKKVLNMDVMKEIPNSVWEPMVTCADEYISWREKVVQEREKKL